MNDVGADLYRGIGRSRATSCRTASEADSSRESTPSLIWLLLRAASSSSWIISSVHIESGDPNFRPALGQFFDVWGVYLSKDCLGGYCAAGDTKIRAYVDGKMWAGDPAQIPLNDQSVMVLTFGSADQLPNPIPTTFAFEGTPAG